MRLASSGAAGGLSEELTKIYLGEDQGASEEGLRTEVLVVTEAAVAQRCFREVRRVARAARCGVEVIECAVALHGDGPARALARRAFSWALAQRSDYHRAVHVTPEDLLQHVDVVRLAPEARHQVPLAFAAAEHETGTLLALRAAMPTEGAEVQVHLSRWIGGFTVLRIEAAEADLAEANVVVQATAGGAEQTFALSNTRALAPTEAEACEVLVLGHDAEARALAAQVLRERLEQATLAPRPHGQVSFANARGFMAAGGQKGNFVKPQFVGLRGVLPGAAGFRPHFRPLMMQKGGPGAIRPMHMQVRMPNGMNMAGFAGAMAMQGTGKGMQAMWPLVRPNMMFGARGMMAAGGGYAPAGLRLLFTPQGLPLRPGAAKCKEYESAGSCKLGKDCKFDHSGQPAATQEGGGSWSSGGGGADSWKKRSWDEANANAGSAEAWGGAAKKGGAWSSTEESKDGEPWHQDSSPGWNGKRGAEEQQQHAPDGAEKRARLGVDAALLSAAPRSPPPRGGTGKGKGKGGGAQPQVAGGKGGNDDDDDDAWGDDWKATPASAPQPPQPQHRQPTPAPARVPVAVPPAFPAAAPVAASAVVTRLAAVPPASARAGASAATVTVAVPTSATDTSGWKRLESRSKKGVFYYFHAATGGTQTEPPPPWEVRESRRNPGVRYYWDPTTQTTSTDKPEL